MDIVVCCRSSMYKQLPEICYFFKDIASDGNMINCSSLARFLKDNRNTSFIVHMAVSCRV